MKKYKVTLTADERRQFRDLIAAGKGTAQKLAHARILLKADAAPGGPAWPDDRIADAVEVSTGTVARVRQRFVEQSLDAALDRKNAARPPVPRTLDGRAEARPIAAACSSPPTGRARGTMQLLADRLVELKVVDSVSDETVPRVLQKTTTTGRTTRPGRWSRWTRRASSGSGRWCNRCRRNRDNPSGSTTSTCGTGRPTCS